MQIGVINNEEEVGWSEIGCELPKGQGVSAATGAGSGAGVDAGGLRDQPPVEMHRVVENVQLATLMPGFSWSFRVSSSTSSPSSW